MVAVLLLVSVFLMTVGVSEGSIISRILCKHCKYRCQKSYVLCKPFSFVGLRKNCGSTRNECWESCDRTVCWNAIFNTPINNCYQKWSCVFYQIISAENKKKTWSRYFSVVQMHWTVYNKAICNLLLKVIKVSYIKRTLTFTSIYVRQENS